MPTDADKALYRIAEGNILRPLRSAENRAQSITDKATETVKIVAKRLRCLRRHRGVSLRHLAKAMGLSAAYVSDVELGRRNLSAQFAERYVKTLLEIAA